MAQRASEEARRLGAVGRKGRVGGCLPTHLPTHSSIHHVSWAATLPPWLSELPVPRGSCVELTLRDIGAQGRPLLCPRSELPPGSR